MTSPMQIFPQGKSTTTSNSLQHQDIGCPLVDRHIACYDCGYPSGEARWQDVEEYEGHIQWPVYDEAKGG
jgi:hypothetical protein